MIKMRETLIETGDVEAKRADIIASANNKIESLNKGLEEEKPKINAELYEKEVERVNKAIKSITSWQDLELYKLSDEYIRFFTNIFSFTKKEAADMSNEIKNALYEAFKNGAIDATELRKELKTLDTQFKKLTDTVSFFSSFSQGGFQGLTEAFSQYGDKISDIGVNLMNTKAEDIKKGTKDSITKILSQMNPEIDGKVIDSFDSLFEAFGGDTAEMGKFLEGAGSDLISGAESFAGAISIVDMIIKNVASTIDGIQNIINQLNEYRSEDNKIGEDFVFVSDFNKFAASGWEKLKSGDIPGAIADTVQSIISIFNNVQRKKIKDLDDQIKEHEKSIKRLGRAYEDLERAQEELLGSDWIKNQDLQIANLRNKIADLRAQLDAERAKGKSADQDVIDDYKDEIIDAENEIVEKQKEVSEEMLETDITSAARDFAQSWLDAYLTFGDTMGAMKGKFKDMMKSLVKNSLLAKIVKNHLQKYFDEIDNLLKENGEVTPTDVKRITEDLVESLPMLDAKLRAAVEGLGRVLGNEDNSDLTGIAKGAAQASEETMLTVAGYGNSILYNEVAIKNDVAAIRAALEGKTAAKSGSSGTSEEGINNGQLFALQQQSVAHLQAISNNTAETAAEIKILNDKMDSIISAPGSTSRKTLNTTIR